jgi:ferredoxin
VPEALRGTPGIRRDASAEDQAFLDAPLESFHHLHGAAVVWALQRLWQAVVPTGPRLMRAIGATKACANEPPASTRRTADPAALTRLVRSHAVALGLSQIGIAPRDERYLFTDLVAQACGHTVVVCVLEQRWEPTQLIPGPVSEQTALSTNAELMQLEVQLASYLHELGYQARPHTTEGVGIVQHYAVEAGLGQMGMNGQLLTPWAGSRCRLSAITTDAPLVRDHPRDFGVPALCDRCRACVRRCPSGAIPGKRAFHRGVEKTKLNLARCFPVVAQVHGCSVCMKVCPVQRYGLASVHDHFERTGEVLGAETDELEGYVWPLDGVHYGPGDRPKLPGSFFDVPGFDGDTTRRTVVAVDNPLM